MTTDGTTEAAANDPPACAPRPAGRVGWLFIAVYGMAHVGLWMALLPPILVGLPLRVRAIAPAGAADGLALVVGVGALLALLANPFFGRLSDRTTSRLGMRRPWLLAGAAGGLLGLAVVATATSIVQLTLGWAATQLAFNAQLAALAAIFADRIPAAQRGVVSGIVNITTPLGMVGGTFLVEALADSARAMFLLPAAVALASAAWLAWLLPDRRLDAAARPGYGWREFLGSFWIAPRRYPDFSWTWCSRFLLFAGVSLLMTFQEFYLIDRLGSPPGAAPHLIFLATLVQSGAVVLASAAGGVVSDACGRRRVFVAGAAAAHALALLVIALATSFAGFLAGTALAGAALGVYLTVDLALVNDVLPERGTHAAKNLGVFNMASVLPQSLMPVVAAGVLAASAGSYAVLFAVAAGLSLLGGWAVLRVRGVR